MFARIASVSVLTLALLAAAAAPAQAEAATADVVVVHGVPGLTVDVYVNGDLTLPGFEPGTITPALPLPPGTYDIAIVAAGGDPALPAIAGSATLAAGDRVTLVAHLAADGTPTLTPFADDLDLAGRGEGRLIVRHVAAAPAVDVGLERRFWRWTRPAGTLENAANGQQAQVDVRSGRYQATLFPAGMDDAVFGPARVRVRRDEATIVYAIGTLGDSSFGLLTERRSLQAATASVTVVHGVLGLTVDVYVNGALTLPDFEPRTITDPIPLPCGDYSIAIVPAGGDPASPAIAGDVTLEAGKDYSLVAHLAADGTPTLSAFDNDLRAKGIRGRLVVRHVAAAPAVDVSLKVHYRWFCWHAGVLRGLENGKEAGTYAFPARYTASVTPAGMPAPVVLGPADVRIRAGRAHIVYAIGSLADGTLELLVNERALR